jgi:two-component system, chemotaxis family, response regulator Rcp1
MVTHPSILLIEDSPGECELFRLALIQTSFDVVLYTQHDADAALHFLEDRVYHHTFPAVILLDLKLGRRSGCDFLIRVRADARFSAIPVVVFTTSDDQTDLAHCYAKGANGYVVKPGTYDKLVHCIGDICRYWLRWNRSLLTAETRC